MIRVRGPMGTLRVLLLPGECPWSGEEAPAAGGSPASDALPSESASGVPHVG